MCLIDGVNNLTFFNFRHYSLSNSGLVGMFERSGGMFGFTKVNRSFYSVPFLADSSSYVFHLISHSFRTWACSQKRPVQVRLHAFLWVFSSSLMTTQTVCSLERHCVHCWICSLFREKSFPSLSMRQLRPSQASRLFPAGSASKSV
jgi:hypothetical protein